MWNTHTHTPLTLKSCLVDVGLLLSLNHPIINPIYIYIYLSLSLSMYVYIIGPYMNPIITSTLHPKTYVETGRITIFVAISRQVAPSATDCASAFKAHCPAMSGSPGSIRYMYAYIYICNERLSGASSSYETRVFDSPLIRRCG